MGNILTDIKNGVDAIPNKIQDLENTLSGDVDRVYQVCKDLPGNAQAIIRDVEDLPGQVAAIVSKIQDLGTSLIELVHFFGMQNGSVIAFHNLLDGFFSACDNILERPLEKLLSDGDTLFENVLLPLCKLFAESSESLTDMLVSAYEEIAAHLGPQLGALTTRIADIAQKLLEDVEVELTHAITSTAQFPTALQKGPLDACTTASELFKWLNTVDPRRGQNIQDRIDAISNSLSQLDQTLGMASGISLLSQGTNAIATFLKAITNSNPAQAFDATFRGLVFQPDLLNGLLKAIVRGEIWKWASLPGGFAAGELSAWLTSGYPADAEARRLQREYRIRIVSAADAYLREVPAAAQIGSDLRTSDRKVTPAVLADVICTFIETTVQFALEPDWFPVLEADLDGLEDIGNKYASLAGQQMRTAIRTTCGLLFRGVWFFSLQNEALIEMIAATFSSVFGAITESAIRNLTWSLRVYSRYTGDSAANENHVFVNPSFEQASGLDYIGNQRTQPLEFVAFWRANVNQATTPLSAPLQAVLLDYFAYLELCYRRYLSEQRFPTADNEATLGMDVTPLSAPGTYAVRAFDPSAEEEPQPVVWLYVFNQVFVMLRVGGRYELRVNLGAASSSRLRFTVLSSRGGYQTLTVPTLAQTSFPAGPMPFLSSNMKGTRSSRISKDGHHTVLVQPQIAKPVRERAR
jgi:hypothetical protein